MITELYRPRQIRLGNGEVNWKKAGNYLSKVIVFWIALCYHGQGVSCVFKIEVDFLNENDINVEDFFYVKVRERPDLFADPFVAEMVKTVDRTEVLGNDVFRSPILGMISSERLSGGVKTLISMYCWPEIQFWGSACGDNCIPLMCQIASEKDVSVKFSHIPHGFSDDSQALFIDDGERVAGDLAIRNGILDRLLLAQKKEKERQEVYVQKLVEEAAAKKKKSTLDPMDFF